MGGESIYGKNFKDELDSRMLHNGRGILAMANSGEDILIGSSDFFVSVPNASNNNYLNVLNHILYFCEMSFYLKGLYFKDM